jgi:hypothetical protein
MTNRTDAADRALLHALERPGVLVIDDVQRIAAPELDYLRLLVDAPTTATSLVLCGAGAEQTLAALPRWLPASLPGSTRHASMPPKSPVYYACSTRVAHRHGHRSATCGRDVRTRQLPYLGEAHLPRLRGPESSP